MPRSPENRIGEIFGRWKIIKENDRGIAMDHGKPRAKIRNFMIECTQCGYIKESISYKNIYYDSINHPCKTEWEKEHEKMMHGKYGEQIVGQEFKNHYGVIYKLLKVSVPPQGKYKYKTLIYKLECVGCGIKKDTIYQTFTTREFNFCKCRKNINIVKESKTREEIIKEIDDEIMWMLELNEQGQLINYLKNKFPEDELWEEILQEENYG
jgi:hypothetical protein